MVNIYCYAIIFSKCPIHLGDSNELSLGEYNLARHLFKHVTAAEATIITITTTIIMMMMIIIITIIKTIMIMMMVIMLIIKTTIIIIYLDSNFQYVFS